jgi:hypothetical protein
MRATNRTMRGVTGGLVFMCISNFLAGCDEHGPAGPVAPFRHPLCEASVGLCDAAMGTGPGFTAPVTVAPSPTLPPEVVSQQAHNNLDVAWHDPDGSGPEPGRVFFAFRTAPDHFASSETAMYVVSTADLATWRFEGSFSVGRDMREPQLVSVGGKLLFYWVNLGTDPLKFEPQGTRVVEWLGPSQFGEPRDVFNAGFLVWRIKPFDQPGHPAGWVHAFGYEGGENIYDLSGDPIRVHWLKSNNGLDWEPVVADQPIVLSGGASETDGVFLPNGAVIAVARNEAGDETGFGSKICRAEAGTLGTWRCNYDRRKYDSPLVFRHDDAVWLVGRRHLGGNGDYDLQEEDLSLQERWISNQLAYWQTPKRCSLWRIDPVALTVTHVLDLPSAGDTCFAETIDLTPSRSLLFNYTSPFDDLETEDPSWLEGQRAPTLIYRTVLSTGTAATP